MRNLAGDKECDRCIRAELDEAGIERVKLSERLKREVAASIVGKLGPFLFERAWYYWVVKGPVPLVVADEMYAHPVGNKDVRVAGHCGCPPPSEWAHYFDGDGVPLRSDPKGEKEAEHKAFLAAHPDWFADEPAAAIRFVPDAAAVAARAVVESYHIDSQEGLNLFVETIRRHGLDKSVE